MTTTQPTQPTQQTPVGALPVEPDPTAAEPGRPWWRTAIARSTPIVIAVIGVLAVWYLLSYVVLPPEQRFLLPPPHQAFGVALSNPNIAVPMFEALGRSILVAIVGLAISCVIGVGWAVLMAQSSWAEKILYPYAVILQTIPILALVPLIGIWMGYSFSARVAVCVLIAIFPMISNTFFGLQSATPAAHDLMTLNRATRMQRLLKLEFPAAVPAIFTGLRTAAGLAVIGAIVGDFFFQQGAPGIGSLLRVYTQRLSMEPLLTAVTLTALFGVLFFTAFAVLDRAIVGRWYGRPERSPPEKAREPPVNRRPLLVASTLVTAALLAACGSGATDTAPAAAGAGAPAAPAGGPLELKGVCPDTVVMQQDWQPEAEHGAMYSVVGPNYTIDTNTKSVTGPLVAQGVDTGVKVEVRAGGPNTGFKPVPALMYTDDKIVFGAVNTDDAIVQAAKQLPTVAVTSQMTVSPQILMWDPASYPGATTIKQVAAAGATIVTSGEVLPALLESQGIMKKTQSDQSYDGSPSRFVSDPKIVQQGFATAEPFIYENEIAQWKKPIASEVFANYGYTIYPEPLAVRADKVAALTPCLKKLVPIMQRAQVDYIKNPAAANDLIVKLVDAYQTGWTYTAGDADFSVKTQVSGKFVTNDPASGVFGKFDPKRMTDTVARFVPLLQSAGTLTGTAPTAESLYTNQFIDDSIKLS